MDMGGLFSIMMRHATTSPETESTFRDPCYAMISDNYMNLTARVGYHFSVVDAYCGQSQNKNYISLLFQGGAADYTRRTRRARAIAEIVENYGFSVELKHDLIKARLNKGTREETVKQLEMLGSLLQVLQADGRCYGQRRCGCNVQGRLFARRLWSGRIDEIVDGLMHFNSEFRKECNFTTCGPATISTAANYSPRTPNSAPLPRPRRQD